MADTAWGAAECCITPRDHNPSAINLVKHKLTNINGYYCCSVADIELCADFRRCLRTVSADIAQTISAIQHTLDYAIYGRGSAFDVAHEVTIMMCKYLELPFCLGHLYIWATLPPPHNSRPSLVKNISTFDSHLAHWPMQRSTVAIQNQLTLHSRMCIEHNYIQNSYNALLHVCTYKHTCTYIHTYIHTYIYTYMLWSCVPDLMVSYLS